MPIITNDYNALTPENLAVDSILEIAGKNNLVVKIWTSADVRTAITEQEPEFTDEQVEDAVAIAVGSSWFGDLADCTDYDWTLVGMAVDEGVKQVGGGVSLS